MKVFSVVLTNSILLPNVSATYLTKDQHGLSAHSGHQEFCGERGNSRGLKILKSTFSIFTSSLLPSLFSYHWLCLGTNSDTNDA
jgi:hypothetical protein